MKLEKHVSILGNQIGFFTLNLELNKVVHYMGMIVMRIETRRAILAKNKDFISFSKS